MVEVFIQFILSHLLLNLIYMYFKAKKLYNRTQMSVLELNMTLKHNINKEQDFTSEVPILCKLSKTI